MKKIIKMTAYILLAIIFIVVLFFAWLTITEYNPSESVDLDITSNNNTDNVSLNDDIDILTWNIGYAGLGKNSDFFMDGGSNVKSASEDDVNNYLNGIYSTAFEGDGKSDIYLFQEVDYKSTRTYKINETAYLTTGDSTYAPNYVCKFVPYPFPPIGSVYSGIMTDSSYTIESSQRIALPCPFSWPVRTANLKRCLLVNYLPIEGSDKYLVIIDLHLEAYDNGEGKIAQTNKLKSILEEEYNKGNYVIAGGDFNQQFPGASDAYPVNSDIWIPGQLESSMIPDGWSFAYDLSSPTCRLLNQPYDPTDTENTQYYSIDGFIVSPNISVNSIKTLNEGFENSDHNPVKINIKLTK